MDKDTQLSKMNIVHINVESPFMDNSGYQETLLAKSHKHMCNNVTIINNNHVLNDDGTITTCEAAEYYNDAHVKIVRMELYDKKDRRHYDVNGLFLLLKREKPDFIMIHGVFAFDVLAVAKYVKKDNKNCIVIADSHATRDNANIMANNPRNIVFRALLKPFNRYMSRYYHKVYGIVEDAVDLMVRYAGIPRSKTAVLGLGYDETLIDFEHQIEIKEKIRDKYDIPQDAFLLVHGGKLSEGKKTQELISIIPELPDDIHVVVFGDFDNSEYKESVYNAAKQSECRVHFTGFFEQKEIYDLYLAADAAVFPGTASCLRQQAVATGLPLVVGYNEADEGINLNLKNNAICLHENWTRNDLLVAIKRIYNEPQFKSNAQELSEGDYRKYSYGFQAKMIIEDC